MPPAPAALPGPSAVSFAERASALLWEDWLRHAPQTQQAEMLELAQRQGFVFVHQVPRPADGVVEPPREVRTDGLAADSVALLRRLLSGANDQLAVVPALDCRDESGLPALSAALPAALQRLAVWRAIKTPDVALFRARAGATAYVLAEIAVQAARQGKRVLLASSSAAPLDATLAKLQCPSPILPVRLLGPGESAATLAPTVRALTLDEQRQAFQSKTMQQAEQALTAAEDCCRCRQAEEPLWPELHELAANHAGQDRELQGLRQRCANVSSEVQAEADQAADSVPPAPGSFAAAVLEQRRTQALRTGEIERVHQELQARQTDGVVALAEVETALSALEPLSAARSAGKWWTLAFWKAKFAPDLQERVQVLVSRRASLLDEQTRRAAELAQLAQRRQELDADGAVQRRAIIDAETERRRREWEARIDAVRAQLAPLERRWAEIVALFRPPTLAPEALTPAAVATAQARWQEHRQQDEAAGLFARQWATFLHDAAPRFLKQLPRYASLVAGTHAALQSNADAVDGDFDLVIVEEADRLLENDLLRIARRGRRWLFVGELPAAPAAPGARPSCFAKLWQTLHVRPAPQPYIFRREGERLCCQLRPVSSRDRQFIESERLADFPEIELRILALPRSQPQLVQVVFPPSMTLARAKELVYRELQEVALHVRGRNFWLEETAAKWIVHFDVAAPTDCAELDAGLCERLAADGVTCRLEFDKAIWPRPQVDQWIERYLRSRDPGRTVDLMPA